MNLTKADRDLQTIAAPQSACGDNYRHFRN
jgi:hypothetical protein